MSLQLINDECFTEEEERAVEQQQSPKKATGREEVDKKPRAVRSPEENVTTNPTGEVEKKRNKEKLFLDFHCAMILLSKVDSSENHGR